MSKTKAGKKSKAKSSARKPARRSAPRKAAPKAAPKVKAPVRQYPCNVIVNKGAERLPVMVKDEAQYAQLADQFGEKSIEVQS